MRAESPASAVPPVPVAPGVSGAEFRDVAGRFPTGVTVVGIAGPGGPRGVTVNSFTSVSLDPPLVLVCLRRGSRGEAALRAAGAFSVNLLAEDQDPLARRFATADRRPGEEFDGIGHRPGRTGSPLLDGTAGHFDCLRVRDWTAGDHTVFVGEVVDLAAHDRRPLVFHRGRYHLGE